MTASDRVSPELLQACEDAKELLADENPDRTEVERKLLFLLKKHNGWVQALDYVAMLAPIARNRKAWDYVREGRRSKIDPSIGYLAYMRLLHDMPTEEEKEQWFDLMEYSAQRGFLQARLYVATKRASKRTFLRILYLPMYRLYLIVVGLLVATRNANDNRLPKRRQPEIALTHGPKGGGGQ